MSGAVTRRRCATLAGTHSPSGTRSPNRSSPAKTGAGATSTTFTSKVVPEHAWFGGKRGACRAQPDHHGSGPAERIDRLHRDRPSPGGRKPAGQSGHVPAHQLRPGRCRARVILGVWRRAASRRARGRRVTATLTVERYAVPVFEREGPVPFHAGARLTRMDVQPTGVDDAVEVFGDTAVPWLAETGGCRCILYLVDRHSGRTISESIWKDTKALAGSRSAAAATRVEAVASAGVVVRAVEEYTVAFSSARKT